MVMLGCWIATVQYGHAGLLDSTGHAGLLDSTGHAGLLDSRCCAKTFQGQIQEFKKGGRGRNFLQKGGGGGGGATTYSGAICIQIFLKGGATPPPLDLPLISTDSPKSDVTIVT